MKDRIYQYTVMTGDYDGMRNLVEEMAEVMEAPDSRIVEEVRAKMA